MLPRHSETVSSADDMPNGRTDSRRMATARSPATLTAVTLVLVVFLQAGLATAASVYTSDSNSLHHPAIPDTTGDASSSYRDSDMTIELAEMVSRLQAQVSQLQEQRAEDRALLSLLRDTVNVLEQEPAREGSGTLSRPTTETASVGGRAEAIARFERQLSELKSELSGLATAKEKESERFNDVHELRLEFDGVHSECQKLRLEVQAARERREADGKFAEQQRNVATTVRWLQKSVGELRREMGEVAAVQNISASLGQQQQCQTGLTLIRSDVVALRSQLEETRVQQDRDGAKLVQVQQDAWDLQAQQHQITANAQLFREELSELKDEVNLVRSKTALPSITENVVGLGGEQQSTGARPVTKKYPKKSISESGSSNDVVKTDGDSFTVDFSEFFNPTTHHRIRHHGRTRQELETVKSSMAALYHRQVSLDKQLRELRRNHSAVAGNVRHVWGRMGAVLNATHARAAQRASTTRAVEELRIRTERLETTSLDANRTMTNLSATVGGIDKLHSSTVQLFEALEAMEDDYSRRIGDLHDEVAKFESDMGRLSSTVAIVKQDQANHYDTLKATRGDISKLMLQTDKTAYKMAALRGELLQGQAERLLRPASSGLSGSDEQDNHVGGGSGDNFLSATEVERRLLEKVGRMDRALNETNARLDHKADLEHVVRWAQSADQLDEKITNLSQKLQPINDKVDRFEHQLKVIYHQFPSDCSSVKGTESGVYQIYPPNSDAPVKVFCEMAPEDGDAAWTVIQRRTGSASSEPTTGSIDFDRDWSDYRQGFGSATTGASDDYWIGNEALHRLTAQGRQVALRFDLWDTDGRYRYAEYAGISVDDEEHGYALHLAAAEDNFHGNVSDALRYHDGMRFSTKDRDQDVSSLQCARQYEGGWWYNHCQHVNVNGRYAVGLTWFDAANNAWVQLARVQMKLRPLGDAAVNGLS